MKSRIPDPSRYTPKPVDRPRRREKGRSKVVTIAQLLAIALVGGATMVGSLALWAFMRSGSQFFVDVKEALSPKPPEESVDVRTFVVDQIRDVSELTTAVFTMEAVVPAQSDRKIGDFTIGQTNMLYVAYGEVRAGINLEGLTVNDVVTETTITPEGEEIEQVTLTLPAPEIIDSKIDVDRSSVYDYERGWFGPDRAPELQTLAQQEARSRVEEAAYEQGILCQASDRAELVVGQLLETAGFDSVTIETAPGTAAECAG